MNKTFLWSSCLSLFLVLQPPRELQAGALDGPFRAGHGKQGPNIPLEEVLSKGVEERGQGPGEFPEYQDMDLDSEENLVLFDFVNIRLSVI